MTELEKAVQSALRLSDKAAEKLLSEIQRHVKVARSELIRAGVSDILANGNHPLVEDALVTYCLSKMDEYEKQEKHRLSFEYQQDCIRKSKKLQEEAEKNKEATGSEE